MNQPIPTEDVESLCNECAAQYEDVDAFVRGVDAAIVKVIEKVRTFRRRIAKAVGADDSGEEKLKTE